MWLYIYRTRPGEIRAYEAWRNDVQGVDGLLLVNYRATRKTGYNHKIRPRVDTTRCKLDPGLPHSVNGGCITMWLEERDDVKAKRLMNEAISDILGKKMNELREREARLSIPLVRARMGTIEVVSGFNLEDS